jgi:serine/threonine-protein kinase
MPSVTVGDFEILSDEVISRGHRGTVYRGRQRSRQRDVLIRMVREIVPADPEGLRRFHEEAEVLSHLEEGTLAQVYGTGTWNGRLFYATEPVPGEDLASCLAQAHRFTTDEILHIAQAVAQALRAAWKNKISHCEISPSTIFLSPDGAVKVADFAMGRTVRRQREEPFILDQWKYASPEEALGASRDIRSDLYSLGVVLYELAASKPPFDGYDSVTSLLYQLMHVSPSSPREAGASIPKELERVILRCLTKDPEERYQDPDELLRDLRAIREGITNAHLRPPPEDEMGDFEIFEDQILGEGGMGTLYRGRQHSLGRPVAVKVIREAFTSSAEFVQRFRREAELLAQVNDPSVVQVFGTGTWRGRLFYAMELVEGEDVSTRLRQVRRMDPLDVLRVASGVAQALRAAWKYKIVHRDIKPSNILLTRTGQVKVADFGLAKSLRIPRVDSHMIAGTSYYLSPEQGIGLAVDIRSDIYSLGVVLYELLAGVPPFRSDGSFTYVVYQHVHVNPPPLEQVAGAVPRPLLELVERCLAKRPAQRFQTPDELLEDIGRVGQLLRGSVPGARRSPIRDSLRALGGRTRELARRLTPEEPRRAGLLVGIIVLAALSAFFAVRSGPAPAANDADHAAYRLLLGLGEYRQAAQLAEKKWGARSPEAREADARWSEHRDLEIERLAQEGVESGAWTEAAGRYEQLVKKAPPTRAREYEGAREFCEEMAQALRCEREGKWSEALDIYRRYSKVPPPLGQQLSSAIARVEAQILLPR